MAMPSTSTRLTTEPAEPDGHDLVNTPGTSDGAAPAADSPSTEDRPQPLRSVHTSNFSPILQELDASLLVTTYQAGKLVILRPDGERLNTHFRGFSKPMGLAVDGDRLAIGTNLEIWEYHNAPAVARRLEPAGRHDACFLPRSSVCTGDIQIHEMAWANSQGDDLELWFVNTRFSCLCTRSNIHSSVPRWRPPFITALAPEDRCHLNGLCLAKGRPAFVTALGMTDTPGGWRADKKSGGVLMEVATGEVITRGLSMPHSPRSYDGRLWVLESGSGGGAAGLAGGGGNGGKATYGGNGGGPYAGLGGSALFGVGYTQNGICFTRPRMRPG